jgi:hypothetical protein
LARRGPEALAQMRAEGRDPARTPEALAKLGASIRQRNQELREWNREHDEMSDRETFRSEILPKLRDVPITVLMQTTGLSRPYCAAIRNGVKVPHPRHWHALRQIVY